MPDASKSVGIKEDEKQALLAEIKQLKDNQALFIKDQKATL